MTYIPPNPSGPMPPPASGDVTPGFIRSLFDFKFESYVTTRILRVLYVLVTVLYSLGALVMFLLLLLRGGTIGVLGAVIVVPLTYIIYLATARVFFEVLMVVFRIGEDVHVIARKR